MTVFFLMWWLQVLILFEEAAFSQNRKTFTVIPSTTSHIHYIFVYYIIHNDLTAGSCRTVKVFYLAKSCTELKLAPTMSVA